MGRVKFRKGMQRKFIQQVLDSIGCPSLRELRQRGFDVNYSTLKNYFVEDRLLPEDLFKSLCEVAKINFENLNVIFLEENWGKVKGGKKGKRK